MTQLRSDTDGTSAPVVPGGSPLDRERGPTETIQLVEPRLSARGVDLLPLDPEDLPSLRREEVSRFLAFRWRMHGRHLNPSEFTEMVWAGSLFQFLVFSGGTPIGLVLAYQADHANGHFRLGAVRFGHSLDTHLMTAVALSLRYAFQGWPFRKVYAEVPAYNTSLVKSMTSTKLFELEATLGEHLFLAGSYWDLHYFVARRELIEPRLDRWLDRPSSRTVH
jgi:RimJ/RimL family protein N-acetyltransferase